MFARFPRPPYCEVGLLTLVPPDKRVELASQARSRGAVQVQPRYASGRSAATRLRTMVAIGDGAGTARTSVSPRVHKAQRCATDSGTSES